MKKDDFLELTRDGQQAFLMNQAIEIDNWYKDDNNYHVRYAAPEFLVELNFDFATNCFYIVKIE